MNTARVLRSPVDLIERQGWLEPAAEAVQKLIGRAYESGGGAGQRLKDVMHGVWLGHPLHPILTDVTIGAWTVALLLDGMEASSDSEDIASAADAAVAMGLIGAAGTAVSGLTDWQATDEPARRVGLVHGLLNVGVTMLYLLSWLQRRKDNRGAGRGLALAGFALLNASAYLGGELVYHDQVGVNHAAGQSPGSDWVDVLAASELAEEQPRRVEANGVRVLLVRRGNRVLALAETCAHLGGPLSEGVLKDGSIVCPWHGSRFDLESGDVLNGPSAFPQPCFEARTRDGRVEVRQSMRS